MKYGAVQTQAQLEVRKPGWSFDIARNVPAAPARPGAQLVTASPAALAESDQPLDMCRYLTGVLTALNILTQATAKTTQSDLCIPRSLES
jgi:hypothetical protein